MRKWQYIYICLDDDGRYIQASRRRRTRKEAEERMKGCAPSRNPFVARVPAVVIDDEGLPIRDDMGRLVPIEDKPKPKEPKKGRKRKLDTPDEIEAVCFRYYLTPASVNSIAQSFRVSPGVIDRVLKEHGRAYSEAHRDEIDEYRQQR
jgi:hypothetical protein